MKKEKLILSTLALLSLVSCGKKEETKDIIIEPTVQEAPKTVGTQQMEEMDFEQVVQWIGADYKVIVHRAADESLPKATDETGVKYYDNKINIRIVRSDGSEFFNRTFSKSDFSAQLDDKTRKNGALLGLMYSKTEGNNIIFEGSVGSPDQVSEDFIPVVVKLNRMGSLSISRGTIIDTNVDDGV